MDHVLNTLAELMTENFLAAPVLSLLAGVLTSFTPCSLASVPILLACTGTVASDRKKTFRISLAMAGGMAVTFGVFGSVASAVGHRMHEAGHWWAVLMGAVMILMSLQVLGVIHVIPHVHISEKMMYRGYMGAFLAGALGGLFASHCAVPVMLALLALVARSDHKAWWGVLLMVLYALGHSVLLLAAGIGSGYAGRIINDPGYARAGKILRSVLGIIVFLVGMLMIFGKK